ncbi:MAG TPA: hypothetical protein VN954_10265, partial [Ktedonobacteraceae bacterium]|nr:hypothetical protein [Ktedonobacteraceae bacterium]
MIHQTMPTVRRGRLYQMERESVPIDVGTPSWYVWLEEHTSFLFVDHVGAVSVRKIRTDHGELEWKVFRRRMGKVFSIPLGSSHSINLSNLQNAARRLAGKHSNNGWTTESTDRPVASILPVPEPVTTTGSLRSLMRTKLFRPHSASDVITRTRLIERLNVALEGEITLVCAPAGFGKTTLLTQWVQTIDRPNAWLSLDEHD